MPEGDTIHHAARRISAVLTDRVSEQILTAPHPRQQADRWPERQGDDNRLDLLVSGLPALRRVSSHASPRACARRAQRSRAGGLEDRLQVEDARVEGVQPVLARSTAYAGTPGLARARGDLEGDAARERVLAQARARRRSTARAARMRASKSQRVEQRAHVARASPAAGARARRSGRDRRRPARRRARPRATAVGARAGRSRRSPNASSAATGAVFAGVMIGHPSSNGREEGRARDRRGVRPRAARQQPRQARSSPSAG